MTLSTCGWYGSADVRRCCCAACGCAGAMEDYGKRLLPAHGAYGEIFHIRELR